MQFNVVTAASVQSAVQTWVSFMPDAAGEKDQRIVSLTAQLTTARMKEATSERR